MGDEVEMTRASDDELKLTWVPEREMRCCRQRQHQSKSEVQWSHHLTEAESGVSEVVGRWSCGEDRVTDRVRRELSLRGRSRARRVSRRCSGRKAAGC